MKERQVAVAGCGVAGLATALLLARDGHTVRLFERFEAPRPIGSGLMIQPIGLAVLQALRLDQELLARGARIDRLIGRTAKGRAVLDVSYSSLGRGAGFGVGIHRAALFQILHRAAEQANVIMETGRAVAGSFVAAAGRWLKFDDGSMAGPFDIVVDALGSRTPLAPPTGRALAYGALWASLRWPDHGFDARALEQRYHAASRMIGVLPIGTLALGASQQAAFFWSVRADQLEAWRNHGLASWKAEALALWPAVGPLLDQIVDPDQLTFARYMHRTLAAPVEERMIHLGDAWHSASPQLGQGANMALLDAYALALALRQDDTDDALAHAVALRRRHVRLYQALTAVFTPVYQSDGRTLPLARDWLVGPLSRLWPATWIQAAMVSGLIGSPLASLGLASSGGR